MDQMHAMFEGHMDQFGYPPDAFLLGPHEYLAFKVEMYEDGQKTLESFAQYAQEYYIKVPVLISTRAGVDIVIHPEYVEQFTISSV